MSGSGILSTSGQIDWGVLSNNGLTISLEVASRLANAGVDAITVGVGRIVGSRFSFPANGQRELTSSLDQLKGVSSFSNVIWFGFGVKHIVRSLAETEQGAVCVALCGAMAIPYPPFHVGSIMREMCVALETPPELTPSIHQWASLVEVCQGSLQKSHLPLVFHHFYRLLVPDLWLNRARSGGAKAMASAMLTLAKLSTGKLANASFVGNTECAILATIADCLLCLTVEIRDEQDTILYRNHDQSGSAAQAVFLRKPEDSSLGSAIVKKTTCFVSDGGLLFDNETRNAYYTPTIWSTFLSDSFPCWEDLTRPDSGAALIKLIKLYLKDFELHRPYFHVNQPVPGIMTTGRRCLLTKIRSMGRAANTCGRDLFAIATGLLPELELFSEAAGTIEGKLDSIESCIMVLEKECDCEVCSENIPDGRDCLIRAAKSIALILAVLTSIQIDKAATSPSIVAIRLFYEMCTRKHDGVGADIQSLGITLTDLALFVLTGVRQPNAPTSLMASCARGICVYMPVIKDPALDLADASIPVTITGHIQYNGRVFSQIDGGIHYQLDWCDPVPIYRSLGPTKLYVEETENSATIGAYYQAHTTSGDTLAFNPSRLLVHLNRGLIDGFLREGRPMPPVQVKDSRRESLRYPRNHSSQQLFCIYSSETDFADQPTKGDFHTVACSLNLPQSYFIAEAMRNHPRNRFDDLVVMTCPCPGCVLTAMAYRDATNSYAREDLDGCHSGTLTILSPDLLESKQAYTITYSKQGGIRDAGEGQESEAVPTLVIGSITIDIVNSP